MSGFVDKGLPARKEIDTVLAGSPEVKGVHNESQMLPAGGQIKNITSLGSGQRREYDAGTVSCMISCIACILNACTDSVAR